MNQTNTKRILSLDGGGIRGIISVEILAEIEKQIRIAHQRPDMVLADYFHFVAGTSTGAIIATAISLGWSVEKIRAFYLEKGKQMFDHDHWWRIMRHLYKGDRLRELLQQEFGDEVLGTPKLRTLLMMVMRNVTTDQPWVVTNNPNCRFNQTERLDCHLNLPLWQLVRASTAAPGFFPPETITVGAHDFVFVDGSISSLTNPAFFAFLRAVAKPYDICWETGEDKILVVSVGTGTAAQVRNDFKAQDYNLLQAAETVPSSLILSTVIEQDTLCRIFGKCINGHQIDKEIGDLVGMETPGGQHLFTYVRYNEDISQTALSEMGLADIVSAQVQKIDSVDHIQDLIRIGQVAARQVQPEHFKL